VVSAALVAQREVDEGAAAATIPSEEESELVPARSRADQNKEEPGSGDNSRVTARKKVVQWLVYFVSSLLQGLDQGTLACKS
jgi:hypothetical protein